MASSAFGTLANKIWVSRCIFASAAALLAAFLIYRRSVRDKRDIRGKLNGKTVLVTGASQGLGRQLASDFHMAGANVIVSGRDLGSLNRARAAILGEGVDDDRRLDDGKRLWTFALNVADVGHGMESLVDAFIRDHSDSALDRVDIIVNNAGVSQRGDFMDMSIEQHKAIFDVNYFGPLQLTKLLMERRVKACEGCCHRLTVVNICSLQSWIAMPGRSSYSASKAALRSFADTLRREMGGMVRVISVHPGYIATSLDRNAVYSDVQKRPYYSDGHGIHSELANQDTASSFGHEGKADLSVVDVSRQVLRSVIFGTTTDLMIYNDWKQPIAVFLAHHCPALIDWYLYRRHSRARRNKLLSSQKSD